jgi:chromosome segregation ATPase
MYNLTLDSNADRLEILYEARGHEITRLRKEIDRLNDESGSDTRRIRHDVALLKAENEQLKVKLDQAEEAFDAAREDSRNLRNEMEMMRLAIQKHEKNKHDVRIRIYGTCKLLIFYIFF